MHFSKVDLSIMHFLFTKITFPISDRSMDAIAALLTIQKTKAIEVFLESPALGTANNTNIIV